MRRNATVVVLISLFSGFGGTAMTLVAGIWVLELTASPGLAALASLGIYAPSLAAPWLGVLVDRLPRRPLLVAVDVLVSLDLLALLLVDSPARAPVIYVVLLLRGIGFVLRDAAETALLPAAIPATRLADINGWCSSAQEGTRLIAPLAGAALFAWQGPVPVVLLCAALPLLTAILYTLIRLPPADSLHVAPGEAPHTLLAGPLLPPPGGAAPLPASERSPSLLRERPAAAPAGRSRRIWPAVREGMIALWQGPARTPVLVAAAAIALSGTTNAAVLSRVVDGLHLPATHIGFLAAAQGAGSIAAGLVVGRLLNRAASARAARARTAAGGAASAWVAALGAIVFAAACLAWSLPWWPALVAGSVLAGVGLPWALIAALTAIQTGTPDHLLGRVAATGNMLMFGSIAPALPLGAALVLLGAHVPLLLAAGLATSLRSRREVVPTA